MRLKARPYFNINYLQSRWVGYFDLLGTKNLINSGQYQKVFDSYSEAADRAGLANNIFAAWFSDTFLVYSADDTVGSFMSIDQVARWFMYFLIKKHVPVRGAISRGNLYADDKNKIIFGDALLEAYRYGECQNWIGLILTPSAIEHIEHLKTTDPNMRKIRHYSSWKIPFKCKHDVQDNKLAALILGSVGNLTDEFLRNLETMERTISDKSIKDKYARTIEFIKQMPR